MRIEELRIAGIEVFNFIEHHQFKTQNSKLKTTPYSLFPITCPLTPAIVLRFWQRINWAKSSWFFPSS